MRSWIRLCSSGSSFSSCRSLRPSHTSMPSRCPLYLLYEHKRTNTDTHRMRAQFAGFTSTKVQILTHEHAVKDELVHWLRNGITDCAVRCQYLYLCTIKASKLKSPHTDGTLAPQRHPSPTAPAGSCARWATACSGVTTRATTSTRRTRTATRKVERERD